jgi:hypothetical protein
MLVTEFRMRNVPHETVVLLCGHHSTGVTPSSGWVDRAVPVLNCTAVDGRPEGLPLVFATPERAS